MYFCTSGNIVLKPGSSSKIIERDVFTLDDCESSANVMVESADAYAAIVVWARFHVESRLPHEFRNLRELGTSTTHEQAPRSAIERG